MERQHEASLAGKVAIVTGSSRGIGKRAALALARRGARLVVTARTVEASGSELPGTIGETVKEIGAAGGEAVAVAADLSNEEDLEHIVGTAIDRFGGVDILVNNAAVTVGYNWSTPLLEMPRADWLHHFAVNLHAPFTLVQRCVPSMEARGGGRIINVTTGSAEAHRLVEEPNPVSSVKYYAGDGSSTRRCASALPVVTLSIRPPPRASILGTTSCIKVNGACTLTAKWCSQSARGISSNGADQL